MSSKFKEGIERLEELVESDEILKFIKLVKPRNTNLANLLIAAAFTLASEYEGSLKPYESIPQKELIALMKNMKIGPKTRTYLAEFFSGKNIHEIARKIPDYNKERYWKRALNPKNTSTRSDRKSTRATGDSDPSFEDAVRTYEDQG